VQAVEFTKQLKVSTKKAGGETENNRIECKIAKSDALLASLYTHVILYIIIIIIIIIIHLFNNKGLDSLLQCYTYIHTIKTEL